MKRLIAFLSVLLSIPAYAENFTANDKVLFFSTDVLIEVIERNFDKSLQLGVANKYTELMDATTHSVSIADLISVCGVGNLDREKCRNFINDLLTTMDIGDTVKPFYWADYIPYRGDEPSNTFVPHMGFEQDTGVWTIRFPWMKEQSFQKQYPGVEHLGGISACTAESGTVHVADMSKNFSQNEQTGNNCWCKMTFPEESAWVYHTSMDSVTISTGETTDANTMCSRGCALECLGAIRGADESMRAAMFSVVKLNGSNANTSDEKVIIDDLVAAVTPPPPPKPKPAPTPEPEPQPDPCWKDDWVHEYCVLNLDGFYWVSDGEQHMCPGLSLGQSINSFRCGAIITIVAKCASNGGRTWLQKGTPRGDDGRHCWCKGETESTPYNFTPAWVFQQDFDDYTDCAHHCATKCHTSFAVSFEMRSALFGLKYKESEY